MTALDAHRRLNGKRKLAILVVALVVISILALAFYDSESGKAEATNAIAVAVTAPLTDAQQQALVEQFTRYAPDDNRAPVTLTVYVLDGSDAAEKAAKAAADMNAGFPNLYLMDEGAREALGSLSQLQPLAERYPGDPAVKDGYYYALSGKRFLRAAGLENLPECYLALQRSDTYAVTKDAQTQSYYAYQSELLDNIASDSPVR